MSPTPRRARNPPAPRAAAAPHILLLGPEGDLASAGAPTTGARRWDPPFGARLRAEPEQHYTSIWAHGLLAGPEPVEGILAEVQRALRPGAEFILLEPLAARQAKPRAIRRLLGHYFEDVRLTRVRPAPSDHQRRGSRVLVARARKRPLGEVRSHFTRLAPRYAEELPAHLREHYLEQKLRALRAHLPADPQGLLGMDLGCGLGSYAHAVAQRLGARVLGLDLAGPALRAARTDSPSPRRTGFAAADSLHLPLGDRTLDFAYAINLVHHLKRGEQERALAEIHRVLKPRAPFLLFEINTRNPAFRWYMRRVFPRTRRIDRGDEEFVHPDRLQSVAGFAVDGISYATFTPDFVPRWMLPAARWFERKLERGPLAKYAIHYTAVLRKQSVRPG